MLLTNGFAALRSMKKWFHSTLIERNNKPTVKGCGFKSCTIDNKTLSLRNVTGYHFIKARFVEESGSPVAVFRNVPDRVHSVQFRAVSSICDNLIFASYVGMFFDRVLASIDS